MAVSCLSVCTSEQCVFPCGPLRVHNCVANTQVSFDLSTLNSPKQAFAKAMLMDKEMIAINQVRQTLKLNPKRPLLVFTQRILPLIRTHDDAPPSATAL